MAEDLSFYKNILLNFSKESPDIRSYSPVVLAYMGDAVLETVIRTVLVSRYTNKVSDINKKCSSIVKATTQARIVRLLLDEEVLTEEEKSIYRRGRNANTFTSAKNAGISEYKMSTGFEAVLGYLYLSERTDRLLYIVKTGLELLNGQGEPLL